MQDVEDLQYLLSTEGHDGTQGRVPAEVHAASKKRVRDSYPPRHVVRDADLLFNCYTRRWGGAFAACLYRVEI